jgi:hypothetical protein
MSRTFRFLLSTAFALVLTAGSAKAVPTEWYDDWSTTTPTLMSGLSTITVKPDKFPNPPHAPYNLGSTGVTAAQIVVNSTQNNGTPDSFAGKLITMNVKVVDVESGNPGFFTFTFQYGPISTLSKQTSHLEDLKYLSGDLNAGQALGGNVYTPIKWSYAWPGIPRDGTNGRISFTFDVRPIDVQKAPEPSTMLLSCVGLSVLGLRAWRRRRQGLAA